MESVTELTEATQTMVPDALQGVDEEASLLSLPDDDLLGVLQYLSTPDLLSCSAACRRLRGVALRPELWRRRNLDDKRSPGVEDALRLAPCAFRLTLSFYDLRSLGEIGRLAATTRCAAVQLVLEVDPDAPALLRAAQLAIRNQAGLGRLKSLRVALHASRHIHEGSATTIPDLLAEVLRIEGLFWLDVDIYRSSSRAIDWPMPTVEAEEPAAQIPASIERATLRNVPPHFAHCVLRRHAATLQSVALWGDCRSVAPLLAAIPGLRHLDLKCPVMDDLHLVASCAALRSLKLTCAPFPDAAEAAASRATLEAFLRAATHLEELEIELGVLRWFPDLAAPGLLTLRKLAIIFSFCEVPYITAVPKLPALEWLMLSDVVPVYVLGVVNPASMPRLRGLCIPRPLRGTETCVHAAVHTADVRRILTSYSDFYLVVASRSCMKCEHCLKGCHGVPWPSYTTVGFYTLHAPGRDAVNALTWGSEEACEKWMKA
ncbi:uncharacterized protein LOC117646069 isoform X6 [Thrips palmi]|uniref:Uncharacterized protein LOC117646069 isoform X6 n=1 Tax=Thrips palmi TaxID=161013 RepID=A0A6P8YY85_THRPL|nr:uncharacterized protein LOC117646069 isoform X6 [Thrips palmi]